MSVKKLENLLLKLESQKQDLMGGMFPKSKNQVNFSNNAGYYNPPPYIAQMYGGRGLRLDSQMKCPNCSGSGLLGGGLLGGNWLGIDGGGLLGGNWQGMEGGNWQGMEGGVAKRKRGRPPKQKQQGGAWTEFNTPHEIRIDPTEKKGSIRGHGQVPSQLKKWHEHVKATREKHPNVPYRELLQIAKKNY